MYRSRLRWNSTMRRARAAGVGGELVVVDGPRRGNVEDPPAGVVEAACRSRSRPSRRRSRGRGSRPRRGVARAPASPTTAPSRRTGVCDAAALHGDPAVQEQRRGERGADARQPPRAWLRLAAGLEQLGAGGGGAGVGLERLEQRRGRAGLELGVLVEQQAVAAACLAQQRGVVLRLAGRALAARSAAPPGATRATASAEPSSEALSSTRISCSMPPGWVRSIASRQASRCSRPFVFTTQ